MNRREFIAGAMSCAAGAAQDQTAKPRPNVLLYLLNHVRACDLACYNGGRTINVPTPNIDRLAAQGLRFTNAVASFPLSTPARAMLQTGRWPSITGAIFNSVAPKIPTDSIPLAAAFAAAGYLTSYTGVWHLAAGRLAGSLDSTKPAPRKTGVTVHPEFVPPGPLRMGYDNWHAFNYHTEFARGYFFRDEPRRLLLPGYETDAETAIGTEVMHECRVSNKAFFVVVSPHPPHPPWKASHTPAAALEKIPAQLEWRANARDRKGDSEDSDPRCYYAQLHNADENLGRMLQYLEKNEILDRTIVVCASLHGEMLGSRGLTGAMRPYAECVDVPLLIRWPGGGIGANRTTDALCTPLDLYPTLAGLCGLPRPAHLDGVDLSRHLTAGASPVPAGAQAALLMNFVSHPEYPESGTLAPEFRGVRDRTHTYIRYVAENREELYDNQKDPLQTRNLIRPGGKGPAAMQKRLRELLEQAGDAARPGTAYRTWFNEDRQVTATSL